MQKQDCAVWLIRIANLPDGREAIGDCEMPQMHEYGTKVEVVDRIKRKFQGYILEIAQEYQDSLGRIIKKRRGNWEVI